MKEKRDSIWAHFYLILLLFSSSKKDIKNDLKIIKHDLKSKKDVKNKLKAQKR